MSDVNIISKKVNEKKALQRFAHLHISLDKMVLFRYGNINSGFFHIKPFQRFFNLYPLKKGGDTVGSLSSF